MFNGNRCTGQPHLKEETSKTRLGSAQPRDKTAAIDWITLSRNQLINYHTVQRNFLDEFEIIAMKFKFKEQVIFETIGALNQFYSMAA